LGFAKNNLQVLETISCLLSLSYKINTKVNCRVTEASHSTFTVGFFAIFARGSHCLHCSNSRWHPPLCESIALKINKNDRGEKVMVVYIEILDQTSHAHILPCLLLVAQKTTCKRGGASPPQKKK
jgi:hypothetical protein